ncbi:hypothetical protein HGRIS_007066 [Hohenbuehelia grisea]|uniref:Alpha/beta hydrolase fold-3 domain-containing protein n=1 Tax=Hohenbuehelia grisea TaxID=104357 RepID=A0ABR3JC28_9AGAR
MPKPLQYARLSLREVITLPLILLGLPFALVGTLLSIPWSAKLKDKPWRRVVVESTFRYVSYLTTAQAQKLSGTTSATYRKAVAKYGLDPVVEEIGEAAQLFWLGEKRSDYVLLYIHGGAFWAPLLEPSIDCWRYVQQKLKARTNSHNVGVAILKYSLWPEATFPTPLCQTALAINHLLASGVHPSNLQLVGDSAGANIITQVLFHILHPLDGVPSVKLSSPISGAFMISPWASLSANSPSRAKNHPFDVVTATKLRSWGDSILADVPAPLRSYIEAADAPEAWFDGIDRVVDRIFITAGGLECLRDDIVRFAEKLKTRHPRVELVVQRGGVHDDMIMDFTAGLPEDQLGELWPICIQWFAAGFEE